MYAYKSSIGVSKSRTSNNSLVITPLDNNTCTITKKACTLHKVFVLSKADMIHDFNANQDTNTNNRNEDFVGEIILQHKTSNGSNIFFAIPILKVTLSPLSTPPVLELRNLLDPSSQSMNVLSFFTPNPYLHYLSTDNSEWFIYDGYSGGAIKYQQSDFDREVTAYTTTGNESILSNPKSIEAKTNTINYNQIGPQPANVSSNTLNCVPVYEEPNVQRRSKGGDNTIVILFAILLILIGFVLVMKMNKFSIVGLWSLFSQYIKNLKKKLMASSNASKILWETKSPTTTAAAATNQI
jgi:hypothetical protein